MTDRHRTPAPTRAVPRSGSTCTSCIREVVTSTAPSTGSAAPWPVAWTATGSPDSRAYRTAAATSAAFSAATTTLGRWVTAVLNPAASVAAAGSLPSSTVPATWRRSRSRAPDVSMS